MLVDSPPLLSVADSRILSTLTDAVVMIVRAHATPYDVTKRACALLRASGARLLGVALNDVDYRRDGYAYGYKYGGYTYEYRSHGDDELESEEAASSLAQRDV